jgi:hypothetical protein
MKPKTYFVEGQRAVAPLPKPGALQKAGEKAGEKADAANAALNPPAQKPAAPKSEEKKSEESGWAIVVGHGV